MSVLNTSYPVPTAWRELENYYTAGFNLGFYQLHHTILKWLNLNEYSKIQKLFQYLF